MTTLRGIVGVVLPLFALVILSASSNFQCEPKPVEPACEAIDSSQFGVCAMLLGYAWDGEACMGMSGCSCEPHCDAFHQSMEECERACGVVQPQACVPIDPNGYGDCEMVLGVAFTGRMCAYVSGCGCGDDCANFFDSMEECEAACADQMYLQQGDICGSAVQAACGEGLSCCYPCGIPDCDWVCTPSCDESEPGCYGGCFMYP